MLTARGQQHSFSTHERVFLWKCQSFWDRKCLDLRRTRTPNLRIHAECSNLLSYQSQTFPVPYFEHWLWWYSYFFNRTNTTDKALFCGIMCIWQVSVHQKFWYPIFGHRDIIHYVIISPCLKDKGICYGFILLPLATRGLRTSQDRHITVLSKFCGSHCHPGSCTFPSWLTFKVANQRSNSQYEKCVKPFLAPLLR